MNAPLSVNRPDVSDDMGMPPSRVVSISPRAAAALAAPSVPTRATPAFITPRVIDQSAFDDLAATLRAVVDDAAEESRKLATQIALVESAEAGAKKAGGELQERLRLGARMLSAFQSQIVRIEEALAEFDRRETAAQDSSSSAAVADEALARFRDRLEEMTNRASDQLESRIASYRAAADETSAHLAATLRTLAEGINGSIGAPPDAEFTAGAD